MLDLRPPIHAPATPLQPQAGTPARLHTRWARHADEVQAAQRLRHTVFAGELGARLKLPHGTPPGHDADLFDPFCEHLLVCADERVVGTYRVLTPDAARRVGGLYAEAAFDLTRLRPLRATLMEAGRACVHPDARRSGAVLALWAGLGDFMQRNGLLSMLGSASVGMRDGGHLAADLFQQLAPRHLAPIEQQVRARLPLPVDELATGRTVETPTLLKAYLRCGARLLGPPAWEPDFGTADFPLLLQLKDLPARYRQQFPG